MAETRENIRPVVKIVGLNEEAAVECNRGDLLLDVLRAAGKGVSASCGGNGTCGKCVVQVVGVGEVKSCRYRVEENTQVVLPELGCARILDSAQISLKKVPGDPGIEIPPGSKAYGAAIDVGTTTVVVYVEDLATSTLVDVASFVNPQTAFGADVISRIHHVIENKGGLESLRNVVIAAINGAIQEICRHNGIAIEDMRKVTIVGNTTMLHLVCGVDPSPIAFAPFTPAFVDEQLLTGAKSGLWVNPRAQVTVLPSVSGYIGSDITAGAVSTSLVEGAGFSLYLDIGTNGEIGLGNKDRFLCCATAAGPAFEGAKIACGIGGIAGAISHYSAGKYETIENGVPCGICGSGLLDIVAQLLKQETIAMTGFMAEECVIVEAANTTTGVDIVLTPADVREVQLAKAAIFAGIQILLNVAEVSFDDIEHVFLAGGFGNYMDISSACAVGLIPNELKEKTISVGNRAGVGARLALRSTDFLKQVGEFSRNAEYIELSMRQDFNDAYVNAMMFM